MTVTPNASKIDRIVLSNTNEQEKFFRFNYVDCVRDEMKHYLILQENSNMYILKLGIAEDGELIVRDCDNDEEYCRVTGLTRFHIEKRYVDKSVESYSIVGVSQINNGSNNPRTSTLKIFLADEKSPINLYEFIEF